MLFVSASSTITLFASSSVPAKDKISAAVKENRGNESDSIVVKTRESPSKWVYQCVPIVRTMASTGFGEPGLVGSEVERGLRCVSTAD